MTMKKGIEYSKPFLFLDKDTDTPRYMVLQCVISENPKASKLWDFHCFWGCHVLQYLFSKVYSKSEIETEAIQRIFIS